MNEKFFLSLKGEYCNLRTPSGPRISNLMGGKSLCSEQLADARDIYLQEQGRHG